MRFKFKNSTMNTLKTITLIALTTIAFTGCKKENTETPETKVTTTTSSEEETAKGWLKLSAQLNQIWSDSDVDVLALLKQKFSARLPEAVLAQISDRSKRR